MSFFENLIISAGNVLGAAGQMKLARFCFEVYCKKSHSRNEWDDLTVKQQREWALAVWETIKKGEYNGSEETEG